MSDEELNEFVGQLKVSTKLLEATSSGFKDRSKRRLSLPLSGSARDSRKSSLGSGKDGGTGGSRRTSNASNFSESSWSSYDSDFSEDDDLPSPREREQITSRGSKDFCVKNIGYVLHASEI